MIEWSQTSVGKLESQTNSDWAALRSSWADSKGQIRKLQGVVGDAVPSETSLVVFGSLGRGELTGQSDLDWVLLVVGRCSPQHRHAEYEIRSRIKDKAPAAGGPFGGMVFSHEVLHHIGGTSDSNANFTRRMLLLLEGRDLFPIPANSAFDRVRRAVLERYFEQEPSSEDREFFPRFLMNDIIRFWRTVAVDYAAKFSERGGSGWALRNIKLRFSRKLLYSAGLVLCAKSAAHEINPTEFPGISRCHKLLDHTPLNLLALAVGDWSPRPDTSLKIFGSYNEFLRLLGDEDVRRKLERLEPETASGSTDFQNLRSAGREFEAGLHELLFSEGNPVLDRMRNCTIF